MRVEPPQWVRKAGRYRYSASPIQAAGLMAAGLPTALRLAALARRVRADLIHTNGMKAHLLAGLAGRLAGVPVIWHLRDFPPGGWAGGVFRQVAGRLPALILAPSEAVAASVRSSDRWPCPAITLHDPVDLGRFHPGLPRGLIRRELAIAGKEPLIGLVAHLTPWKGHELFLAVARAVTDAVPGARFVVAGGAIYETHGHAGYLDALRRRTAALGLSERLVFLGSREDIPEILADLDVLVHCPTAPEPFGRVLAEAMAVGCPVVAARCGGIPEVVEDQVTGLLVPPMDVEVFTQAVLRLLRDPALRSRLATAGRRCAEALFDVEAHAAGVFEAYQTVVPGRPQGLRVAPRL